MPEENIGNNELNEQPKINLLGGPASHSFQNAVRNEDKNKVKWLSSPGGKAGEGRARPDINVKDPVTEDQKPRDPTTAFERSRGYKDISLDEGHIEQWAKDLKKERILLFSSFDSELLYALSEAVLFHSIFEADEKRDVRSEDHDFTIDELIEAAAATKAKPRVIAAYAVNKASERFLQTLKPDGPTVSKLRHKLDDCHVCLLIVAGTPIWDEVEQRDRKQRFPYAPPPIDFLEPRLRPVYDSDTKSIAAQIREQRKERLWGGASDERFLVNLQESLRNRTLGRKLIDYEEALKNHTADQFREEPDQNTAEGLLDTTPKGDAELQQLYQWVFFIATFFPDLGMAEFTRILKQLMPPPPPPEAPPKDGTPPHRLKNPFDSWPLNQKKILGLCQLHQETRLGSAPAIKFIETQLHDEMHSTFLRSYYGHYDEALVRIEAGRLLTDPNPLIRNAVVDLLADRATREENYYGRSFVGSILRGYIKARTGAAPEFAGDTTAALQTLSQEDRSILFERIVAIIIQIAGDRPTVAESGLAQLQSGGYFEPIFNVLRRAPHADIPPAIAAKAAAILLKSVAVGTNFLVLTNAFGQVTVDLDAFLSEQTLYFIRMTLREPSKGSMLTTLIADLPPELASIVLSYLVIYALNGFVVDSRANPIAMAISGIASQPGFRSEQLAKIAEYLTSEELADGMTEEVFWSLFCFWLAPAAMQKDHGNIENRVVPAIDSAIEKLDAFLSAPSRGTDSLKNMRLLALLLADISSWIDDTAKGTSLSTEVGKRLDRKRRAEMLLLLNELANALNVSITSLQAPDGVFDKAERQKRLTFTERWKGLRDALRAVKNSISEVGQK